MIIFIQLSKFDKLISAPRAVWITFRPLKSLRVCISFILEAGNERIERAKKRGKRQSSGTIRREFRECN